MPTNNIKEDVLKELVEKVTDYGYNDEYGYYNDWADGVRPILSSSLDKYANAKLEEAKEKIIEIIEFHRLVAWSPQDPALEQISKGSKMTVDAILKDLDSIINNLKTSPKEDSIN